MHKFAELRSKQGRTTEVGYDFDSTFDHLVECGEVDCFIVSTEDGFSPLGASRAFFAHNLGIDKQRISELANWNRFENPEVSLVVLSSYDTRSKLRGIILSASETSRCYEKFTLPRHGRPYRDFYYNVAYEAIEHANTSLGARRLAMSHLSGCGSFHEDIATCVAEALAHYVEGTARQTIESFSFVGCCIEPYHLAGIQRLNLEGQNSRNRPIQTTTIRKVDHSVITLQLKKDTQ